MREKEAADGVADRIHRGPVRTISVVHLHPAALNLNRRLFQAEIVYDSFAADRRKDHLGLHGLRLILVLHG